MAKRYVAHIKQNGTWDTTAPNPHVDLGAAVSGFLTMATQQAAGAVADSDTLDVYIEKNTTNWAAYKNASYDHSNTRIDLSSATAAGSSGTISNTDAVIVHVTIGQDDLESFLTAEDNDLETDGAANIADTEIFIGTGAGTGNYAAVSGDATLANTGVLTIAADAVTYAKMQDVSATDRLLGRDTAGAGVVEEIAPAAVRTMINVEDGATADQTGAEIKTAYEAEADTNAFTDADHTKLDGIEASADVTDETNVKAALDGATITNAVITGSDKVLFQDATDTDNLKQDDAQTLANLATPEGTAILSTGEGGGTKYLREDGDGTCSWQTVAGGGDVSKVGTPVNNQVGVWTGDGTIEGDANFTWSGTTLAITGAITVSGNVDGRDVSTDGTKLDGIEANADVTDTTNVTAAGALMDSEVDADIKTLSLPANTTISAFGATVVDDADAATARTTLGVVIGTDVLAQQTIGIADNNLVEIDDLDAAASDYAKFTANGLEGRSYAEVRSDLNVEDGADVTDTTNVTAAGALMDSEVDADIKTLSLPANTTISAFGATLVDDAAASNARDTLGLGTSDNPQFATIELGAATDTTISRVAAGLIAVEGNPVLMDSNDYVDDYNASENLSAGDLVNFWNDAGTLKVRQADADATGKEVDGYVLSAATTGNPATVYTKYGSVITGLSGLTAGTWYYLSTTAGGLTSTAPSGSSNVVQRAGKALSATTLLYQPGEPIELAA